MRNVRLTAAIGATVLSLMGVAATAQGQGSGTDASGAPSSFKGVVVSISPASLTAKGEFEASAPTTTAGGTKTCFNCHEIDNCQACHEGADKGRFSEHALTAVGRRFED